MLSPADQALARRDPSLPGLGLLLDDEALTDALRQSDGRQHVARAAVTYLRYKPATSCMAAVLIEDHHGRTRHAFAKALPAGGRDWAWQRRRLTKRAQADGAFSAALIEEAALLLASPEHDRRVTALFQLFLKSRQQLGPGLDQARPDTMPLMLSPALSPLTAGREPEHVECQILRYKPERRLVALLRHRDQVLGLLRACTHADFSTTLAAARLAQQLNGPRLLAEDASHDCLVTGWIEGESLHPGPQTPAPDSQTFRDIGQLLARIHQSDVEHPVQRPRHTDIEAVRQAADTISLLHPAMAADVRALQRRISDALRQADCPSCLNHGDLSLEQIVREPSGSLRLIDWDSASIGSPAADFGSLLARLCLQELDGTFPADTHQVALVSMLQHYPIPASLTTDTFVKLVKWHTVAGLLRLIPEGFRKRRANWLELMTHALTLTYRMAEQTDTPQAPIQTPPASLPASELGPIQDAARMKTPLAQALNLPEDSFDLQPVRLLRHKPGRRALLQYVLDFGSQQPSWTLIGKWRAKGVDRHGFSVQRGFQEKGFDLPGLSVPEALAMLPEHQLWLQRRCAGQMATTLLGPDAPRELSARLGQAIASLHNADVPTRRHWTLTDELRMLDDRLQQAARIRPAWAGRIEALMREIEGLASRMPANPVTGIHRDCYPDQILIDGDSMVWLDLDLYAEGDPALDVGNFIAHMIEHALRFHDTPNVLSAHQQTLREAFLAHSRHAISAESIEAWTTISLARHIFISTQFADRQHTTAQLLTLCETRLGLMPALSA